MANLQKPWPILQPGYTRTRSYQLASGNSRIFLGDFVVLTSAGLVDLAVAGNRILGIAAEAVAASAPSGTEILVHDDPDLEFRIRSDGVADETHKGNLVDILATTGNTNTDESAHEVDISTAGTGAAQLRILDKLDLDGNAWGDANPMLICMIYEHELSQVDPATPGV